MFEYDGQQFVGIDLHRRRSVIVCATDAGAALEVRPPTEWGGSQSGASGHRSWHSADKSTLSPECGTYGAGRDTPVPR